VGGPLPRRADRQRSVSPGLLPLHRAQPDARPHGAQPARLSLVELSRQRARRGRSAGAAARALSHARAERRDSYRALFRERLAEKFIEDLRTATNGGWALGDEAFKRRIAKAARRRAEPLPKGRPRVKPADKRQLSLL
jgi:hypothetical protein